MAGAEVAAAAVSYLDNYSETTQRLLKRVATEREMGRPAKKTVVTLTAQVCLYGYEWVRVKRGDRLYARARGGTLYRYKDTISVSNMVRDLYKQLWGEIPTSDWLTLTVNTVRDNIENVKETIDTRYVQITPTVLWDTHLSQFVDTSQIDKKPDVFRKLFDTPAPQKNVACIPPLSDELEMHLRERYAATLRELETGSQPEKIEPIKIWANGKHDVYMDMMRCLASIFTRKKPLGCYMLIGTSRSGKSTFVGMIKTLLGTNNCTSVRLSSLGDWHQTHQLADTMFNAPDEEDDKFLQAEADFKTLADHGELISSTMRSHEPLRIDTNFICAFPMNHFPKFAGDSADACLKRSLAIPFYADLSVFDKSNQDFATATYTPVFMTELLGDVLAYATYYSSHPWNFSPTMDEFRGNIDTGSVGAYYSLWKKHFNGFQKASLVYEDYKRWCIIHDCEWKTRNALKVFFGEYRRTSYTLPTGKQIIIYKTDANDDGSNNRIMYGSMVNPATKETVITMHGQYSEYDKTGARSIVDELEEYYDADAS